MAEPLKIIIVDDDVDVAESLAEIFEFDGHEVALAHNGEDAVRAVGTQDFDFAFMDVMMPGMNGVECFRKIHEIRPDIKVFMMTGYSVESLLNEATEGGASGIFFKPVAAAEVRQILADPSVAS